MNTKVHVMLFGTGKALQSYRTQAKYYGCVITGYIDNDKNKWGTFIDGIKVYPPEELYQNDDKIIISNYKHIDEIMLQLDNMGLSNRVIKIEDLKLSVVTYLLAYLSRKDIITEKRVQSDVPPTLIFDSVLCLGWGGIEIWNYKIAEAFKINGIDCFIYRDDKQPEISSNIEQISQRFRANKQTIFELVEDIASDMLKHLPIIVVNNWSESVLLAAYAVKTNYPELVQIVSVAHFDITFEYEKLNRYSKFSNAIFCVSTKIKDTLSNKYGIPKDKLYYKESPVPYEIGFERAYENDEHPIHIAFACRLEKLQKRADLIPGLLLELERMHVNYIMHIAGTGTYEKILKDFVKDKGLQNKVIFYGLISANHMSDFWKTKDVYINLSDFEGTSQAMLEAMAFAVVPVVTDVSGVRDFIKNGENGFITDLEDITKIAESIAKLDRNRHLLHEFGALVQKEIQTRCKMEDYLDVLTEMFHL